MSIRGAVTESAVEGDGPKPPRSVGRRILRATIIVSALTALAKLGLAGREVLSAREFGTGDAMDAFVIAFALPTLGIDVLVGAFQAAFIPTYTRERRTAGSPQARLLMGNLLLLSAAALVVLVAVLALLAPAVLPVLGSSFSSSKEHVTRHLFLILLPAVVAGGVGASYSAVLIAHERFASAMAAPIVNAGLSVAVFAVLVPRMGIDALAIGVVAGYVAELALLVVLVHGAGLGVIPRWAGLSPATREVIRRYLPLTLSVGSVAASLLVDQGIAGALGRGDVAALGYGVKVPAIFLTLGANALGVVVLPHFSEMVARRDVRGIRDAVKRQVIVVLAVAVPAAVAVAVLSTPITRVLFARGAFGNASVHVVSRVQAAFAAEIPAYAVGVVGLRLLAALDGNWTILGIGAVNLVVNGVLDVVLGWAMGVAGIALSTAIVQTVSACVVLIAIRRRLDHPVWTGDAGATEVGPNLTLTDPIEIG